MWSAICICTSFESSPKRAMVAICARLGILMLKLHGSHTLCSLKLCEGDLKGVVVRMERSKDQKSPKR